jgi:hypothetical protein
MSKSFKGLGITSQNSSGANPNMATGNLTTEAAFSRKGKGDSKRSTRSKKRGMR